MSDDNVVNIHTKRKHTEDDPRELFQAYRDYEAARLQASEALKLIRRLEKKFLTPKERAHRELIRSSKFLKW